MQYDAMNLLMPKKVIDRVSTCSHVLVSQMIRSLPLVLLSAANQRSKPFSAIF